MRTLPATFVLMAALAACSGAEKSGPPTPLTIEELAGASFDTRLTYAGDLDSPETFSAYLVAYDYAGLRLHAMVAVPSQAMPAAGFPVLIANHGYVPDPRRYGITSDDIDSRPGDYYRSIPALFASRGFLVVMPDYRGHNSSEGFEQIDPQTDESFLLYGEDVVAMMAGLGDLEQADLDNVFMWSHSMGGIVSMRALLTTDIVRATSFWSTMNVDAFAEHLPNIDGPVILHHARDDVTTPVANSERLAAALNSIDHSHELHVYDAADHLFNEHDRRVAADRDASFFASLISKPAQER